MTNRRSTTKPQVAEHEYIKNRSPTTNPQHIDMSRLCPTSPQQIEVVEVEREREREREKFICHITHNITYITNSINGRLPERKNSIIAGHL